MEISTLLGAIDGKNAVMETQTRSDPSFKNYKNTDFIVSPAACYARYSFTLVHCEKYRNFT